jgi:hypothetical protein
MMPVADLEIIVVQKNANVFEPPCEWDEHGHPKARARHDDGAAKFDLMMPCGYVAKGCAKFAEFLLLNPTAEVYCGRVKGMTHKGHEVIAVPL